MIKLLVDEAYAFDYLSILEVKITKKDDENLKFILDVCKENIKDQIGKNLFEDIFGSLEYEKLFKINEDLFDAVDLVKINKVTAKYVDDLVYERYLAKKDLQSKFFKNSITEVKIGYKNV